MKLAFERKDNEERGRHLISAQSISKNQIIHCERPLLALQSLQNSHAGALSCKHCHCFIGTPKLNLQIHSHSTSRAAIFSSSNQNNESHQNLASCRYQCGELYCSTQCEFDQILHHGHDLLCTGRLSEEESTQNHPLIQFKIHAIQTNEIFLMVADCLATIIAQRRLQLLQNSTSFHENVDILIRPYVDFTLVPWWDINPDQSDILKSICAESATLFHQVLSSHIPSPSPNPSSYDNELWESMTQRAIHDILSYEFQNHSLVSMEMMGKLIGSYEQNAIGVRARHPLCRSIFDVDFRQENTMDLSKILNDFQLLQDFEEDQEEGETDSDVNTETIQETNSLQQEDEDEENAMHQNKNISESEIIHEMQNNDVDNDEITNIMAPLKEDLESNIENDDSSTDSFTPYSLSEITQYLSSLDINEDDSPHGDDLDQIFIPLDGTAMFATTCKMNHSCLPNVLVRYKAGWGSKRPLILQWIALKDIPKGEELCISYISNSSSLKERTEELLNYGFICSCPKCLRERSCGDISCKECIEEKDDFEDLFGSDEEEKDENVTDDLFGSDIDDDSVENDESVDNCEESFQNHLKNIQTKVASPDGLGRMEMTIIAPVSSFILTQGALACQEFESLLSTNLSTDTQIIQKMKMALSKCLDIIPKRNYDACQIHGSWGESLALNTLTHEGSWTHSAWRIAYHCCAITAALGCAGNGCFVESLVYLDKTCILGFQRKILKVFFNHVEYHAQQCHETIPYHHFSSNVNMIHEYRREEVKELGLDKSFSYPIIERVYFDHFKSKIQNDFIGKNKPLVLREFAKSWPAIQKWR